MNPMKVKYINARIAEGLGISVGYDDEHGYWDYDKHCPISNYLEDPEQAFSLLCFLTTQCDLKVTLVNDCEFNHCTIEWTTSRQHDEYVKVMYPSDYKVKTEVSSYFAGHSNIALAALELLDLWEDYGYTPKFAEYFASWKCEEPDISDFE